MKEYIIIGLGVLIILLTLYIMIKLSNKFRKTCYSLFLYAEHNVVKGRKMDYVVNQIYDLLPIPMKILPKSAYKKIIQDLFNEVHDLLDDGKVNKSNKRSGK